MQSLEEEANAWIVRLEEGGASSATLAEFETWRKQSAQHEEAFERLSRFWGEVEAIEKLGDYAHSDAARDGMRHMRMIRRVRIACGAGLGAVAASLVAIVGVNIYDITFGVNRPFEGAFQTARGEQETIALPDGSTVILNTQSALHVAYQRGNRTLRLERGEAFFEVASNRKRPFTVQTPQGDVTAVGTAFSIKLQAEALGVTVSEGRVLLGAQPDAAAIEVFAGQAARIGNGVETVLQVSDGAINKALDWRDGVLTFEGETLETVISEISRYTDVNIEISDEGLKSVRIVAYYKIGGIERLFEALELMANVNVERVSASPVRLRRVGAKDI